MKLTELEDYERIVTKDYLDIKLNELRQQMKADLLEYLVASNRWMMGMILGLYAAIIIGYFLK